MNERHMIVGGADIYAVPNPHLHTYSLCLYVRAGSLYESHEENGITHLFEHTVFRNLEWARGKEHFSRLAANGLYFNAGTYKEFLQFELSGPPESFPLALELLAAIPADFVLPVQEYEAEIRRIKAELTEGGERRTIRAQNAARVWQGTSLAQTVSGYCRTLDRTSRRALNEYKRRILRTGNLFFYVTGCVTSAMLDALGRCVSDMALPVGEAWDNTAPVPADFGHRDGAVTVCETRDEPCFRLAFDVDNAALPAGVMDALFELLFVGDFGLFYRHMSLERGWIYGHDGAQECYRNVSSLAVQFDIDRRYEDGAVEAALSVFRAVREGRFELEPVLRYLMWHWQWMQDKADDLNWSMAYENHIRGCEPLGLNEAMPTRYAAVTREAVIEAAREIFCPAHLVLSVQGSRRLLNRERLWEAARHGLGGD